MFFRPSPVAIMSNNVPVEVIRVFLLIENRLLREALVRLFRKRSDMLVVGESGQTDLTPEDIFASNCDVLVIASFQTNWGAAGVAVEKVRQLGLKVVLIGMDADESQFISSVRSGVSGYLLKDA